jgi:hypothetical protein
VVRLPRPPALGDVFDPLAHSFRRAWRQRALFRRGPAQGESHRLAFVHRKGGAHGRVLDLHRHSSLHGDAPDAAEGATAAFLRPEERLDETVLGTRRQPELQLDRAADALERPEQLVRRVEAKVVATLAIDEGKRVEQPHGPGAGREGGLDHERTGEISPLRLEVARGPDRPVTGVGIEQAREDRVAVVSGQAEPIDRAGAIDERGCVAVGEESVVRDRLE